MILSKLTLFEHIEHSCHCGLEFRLKITNLFIYLDISLKIGILKCMYFC